MIASATWVTSCPLVAQVSLAPQLVAPAGCMIVGVFFDIGRSRSLPWKRRPEACRLLAALADEQRGFSVVVIGEPQRAFYGNRFSLTLPVFTHCGTTPRDPASPQPPPQCVSIIVSGGGLEPPRPLGH